MEIDLNGAKLKRGDSYRLKVTLTDGTIGVTDILEWQARRKVTDLTPFIAKSSTAGQIVRNSATEAIVTLLPADTALLTKGGSFVWEFQRKSPDGLTVDTLILPSGETFGTFEVEPDVLRP